MMKRRGWWLLVVLAASGTAWAQVPQASEAEHRRGMQLRVEGRHMEAAAVFRDIYAQTREPRALARQGLAEAAAERWVDADEHLRAALGYATDAWINTNRQNLARDLGLIEGHLGALEISSTASGELRINGEPRGRLPLTAPLRVMANTVARIELRADGYAPLVQEVSVASGVATPVRVTLQPVRAVAVVTPPVVTPPVVTPPAVTPPVVTPPVVVRRPDPVVVPPVVTPPSTARWQLPLGVAGIGVGVGLIGLGVAGLVLRNDNATQFGVTNSAGRNYCGLNGSDQVVSLIPGSSVDCNGLYDAGRTWQSVSVAGFIAGGVFAAVGTVLLVTRPSSRSGERAAIRCGMGPGDIGIACGGTL